MVNDKREIWSNISDRRRYEIRFLKRRAARPYRIKDRNE
jgi:hypothetical protein